MEEEAKVSSWIQTETTLMEGWKMADLSSLTGSIGSFAGLMVGISVATERVVEIVKSAFPWLAKPWPQNDQARAGIVQLIAAIVGAVIASQMPDQVRSAIPAAFVSQLHWQGYAVIGLLASGGSGTWNHVLDILAALKVKQEASARAVQAPAPAPPAPAAAAAGVKP